MSFKSNRTAVYKLRQKYWNLETIIEIDDRCYRRANIPPIIWNDGNMEWSRQPWFKGKYNHMGNEKYYF